MKRIIGLFILIIVLLTGVQLTHAQGYMLAVTVHEVGCAGVIFSYESNADGPNASVVITSDSSVDVLYQDYGYPGDQGAVGPYTVEFPPQAPGTVITLTISNISVEPVSIDWTCEAPPAPAAPFICWAAGVTPSAIYLEDDTLVVYEMKSRTQGSLAFHVTQEDLAQLPEFPTENMLVKSSSSGLINFYKLTSGEYQINVGPVPNERKVFVCIMDNIAPTKIKRYSFYLNQ